MYRFFKDAVWILPAVVLCIKVTARGESSKHYPLRDAYKFKSLHERFV
jgi:hypothetical protein